MMIALYRIGCDVWLHCCSFCECIQMGWQNIRINGLFIANALESTDDGTKSNLLYVGLDVCEMRAIEHASYGGQLYGAPRRYVVNRSSVIVHILQLDEVIEVWFLSQSTTQIMYI
eukprot:925185_1